MKYILLIFVSCCFALRSALLHVRCIAILPYCGVEMYLVEMTIQIPLRAVRTVCYCDTEARLSETTEDSCLHSLELYSAPDKKG